MNDRAQGQGPIAPADDKMLWVPWEQRERARAPWTVEGHFGETVAPPNEQKTNNKLSNEEVLQPRDEPVGISHAFPLRGGNESSGPLEQSGSNKPTNKTGINL